MNNRWMRNSLVYLLIVIAVITVFYVFFKGSPIGGPQEVSITEVITMASEHSGGAPLDIEVSGDAITIRDGARTFTSKKEPGSVTRSEYVK